MAEFLFAAAAVLATIALLSGWVRIGIKREIKDPVLHEPKVEPKADHFTRHLHLI